MKSLDQVKRNTIRALTFSSLTLVLCFLCLLFFRGPISIMSAFFIPVIIVLFARYNISAYYGFTLSGLIIITLINFPTQIIFAISYFLFALALRFYLLDNVHSFKINHKFILLYLLLISVILFISIHMTDLFFSTPLHQMMLKLANNNLFVYFSIILIESLLIVYINVMLLKTLFSRITL